MILLNSGVFHESSQTLSYIIRMLDGDIVTIHSRRNWQCPLSVLICLILRLIYPVKRMILQYAYSPKFQQNDRILMQSGFISLDLSFHQSIIMILLWLFLREYSKLAEKIENIAIFVYFTFPIFYVVFCS